MNRHSDPEDHTPQRKSFELSKTQIFVFATILGFIGPAVAGYVTYKVFQSNIDMRVASAEEQVHKVPMIEKDIAVMQTDVSYMKDEQAKNSLAIQKVDDKVDKISDVLNEIYREIKKP